MAKLHYDLKKFEDAKLPSELQYLVDHTSELQNLLCGRVSSAWYEEYKCCRREEISCEDCILDKKHKNEFKKWITPAFEDSDNTDKIK